MKWLIDLYYVLPLFWIIFEIYQIYNRDKFYFKPINISTPSTYVLFYYFKICYTIWIVCGCIFTVHLVLFLLLPILSIGKVVFLFGKKSFYINVYDLLSTLSRMIILLIIFLRFHR